MKYRKDQIRHEKISGNGDGIAEIVGALLLTSVIAIAIGMLAIVVLSNVSPADTPTLRAGTLNDGGNIDLIHQGGDILYRDTTLIKVDGVDRTDDFKVPEGVTWSKFSVGDRLISSIPHTTGTEILIIYTGSENPTVIEALFCQPGIPSPVADFTFTPTSGYAALEVSFEDISSGDPTSWYWDFGDNSNSTIRNPTHTFIDSGLYEVTLTSCNKNGCDSVSKNITVFGFSDLVVNESVFVYGSQVNLIGGNRITGINSTVIITDDLDLTGGIYLSVTNVYINGSVNVGSGAVLGSEAAPGLIDITGDLNIAGGTSVYGDTYAEGNVDISSSYVYDDLYTNGNLNFITGDIYGEVHVDGDFSLISGKIHDNIYVNGDLTLGWTPAIDSEAYIYYTGLIYHPAYYSQNILDKCIHVSSVPQFSIPVFINMPIPSAKEASWYDSHGYVSGGDLASGIKIYADSYSFTDWIIGREAENVIIVASTGDITISHGGIIVTGVLFAPNGKVTFNGDTFEGLVIAKDGFYLTDGGTEVIFRNIANYISDSDQYPFNS